MKTTKLLRILCCAALALPASCGNDEADAKVRKEISEAGTATAEYMAKKLDQWRSDLKGLDDEIAEWKKKVDAKAADASDESKRAAEETLAALKEKREALAVAIDDAGKATAEAWKDLEAGFENSWTEFKKSFDDAKKRFQDR